VNESDARLKTYITDILKKNKTLNEREVKAAVRKGLKLGGKPLGTGVIREVRRSLRIDRPRAIAYARNLLAKYPTLKAKKVIEDVKERFGISLAAPDVSHLRPAAARRRKVSRRKRAPRTKVEAQSTGKSQRSRAKVDTQPMRKSQRSSGTVTATHKATGTPEEVARFFRSLAQ
jgi:hypothetical protein